MKLNSARETGKGNVLNPPECRSCPYTMSRNPATVVIGAASRVSSRSATQLGSPSEACSGGRRHRYTSGLTFAPKVQNGALQGEHGYISACLRVCGAGREPGNKRGRGHPPAWRHPGSLGSPQSPPLLRRHRRNRPRRRRQPRPTTQPPSQRRRGRGCLRASEGERRERTRVSRTVRPGVYGRGWAEHVLQMPSNGRGHHERDQKCGFRMNLETARSRSSFLTQQLAHRKCHCERQHARGARACRHRLEALAVESVDDTGQLGPDQQPKLQADHKADPSPRT